MAEAGARKLAGVVPAVTEAFAVSGDHGETRATFDLDAAFLAPGAVISASLEQLIAGAVASRGRRLRDAARSSATVL